MLSADIHNFADDNTISAIHDTVKGLAKTLDFCHPKVVTDCCYTMKFSLATCLATLGKNTIASYRRHVTRCNFGLQLTIASQNLCNRCKK